MSGPGERLTVDSRRADLTWNWRKEGMAGIDAALNVTKGEILFVATANTGLARIAESLVRARLSELGLADQYRSRSAVLPPSSDRPSPVGDYGHTGWCFDLRGWPLTQEAVSQADVIVVMCTREQRAVLEGFDGTEGRVFLLGEMAGSDRDLSDVAPPSRETLESRRQRLESVIGDGLERLLHLAESRRAATVARVGLSTMLFGLEPVPPSLPQTLALFRRAGVRYVDWTCDDMEDDRVYTPEQMDSFAALFDENGLKCEMLHGFENRRFNAVAKGEALDRYVAVQSNRIELCARLGGDTVVIHIPGIFCGVWDRRGCPMEAVLEQSTLALDRLRPICERLGVTLALENSSILQYRRDLERLEYYFARYPASYVTFCLEVGNANIHGPGSLAGLRDYAPWLSALHLHDNQPEEGKEENDHQPPFSGAINWAELLNWLREIGYSRSLSFEIVYKRHLFEGTPIEFLAHSVRRIRRALNLVPELTQRKSGFRETGSDVRHV